MKKLLFPLISVFLAYQSYKLLLILQISEVKNFHWISDAVMAFAIALCGTGIFAFVGFAYPTHKLIGTKYYQLRNVSQLKKWYNLLGVKYFKKALLLAFWGSKTNRKKYFNGTRSGIQNFAYQTYQSEFGHLGALILIGLASIYACCLQHWRFAIFLTFINVIGNFYPILLQRYHRIRIQRFLN